MNTVAKYIYTIMWLLLTTIALILLAFGADSSAMIGSGLVLAKLSFMEEGK